MSLAVSDPSDQRHFDHYGAAESLFYCRDPEILLSGPAGTGKSRACLEKLHACARKYAGMRALIVRKTRASLTESALVTFEEKVVPPGHPVLRGPHRRFRHVYTYPNGSEAIVGGMDNATRIMSTEYDMVYVQEAIELTEDDWEKLGTRLRNGMMPYQQLIADTNPDRPTHWLKQRCDRGSTTLFESRHEDNPTITDDYLARLDRLTGARFLRLRKGLWAASEGMVYQNWDPSIHLIPRFDVPAAWARYWSVDFGYSNPFVWGCWARDPDGRLYLEHEIYLSHVLVEDQARRLRERLDARQLPYPRAVICDWDAEDRATFERHVKIATVPAYKAISAGVQAIQSRLRLAGDGKPRLFVLRNATWERDAEMERQGKPGSTVEEFDGYVWPAGVRVPKKGEVPVDENNHGMDMMRYAVAFVDQIHLLAPSSGPAVGPERQPVLVGRR